MFSKRQSINKSLVIYALEMVKKYNYALYAELYHGISHGNYYVVYSAISTNRIINNLFTFNLRFSNNIHISTIGIYISLLRYFLYPWLS